MKKMLLPFLGILLLAGCEKEAATPTDGETDTAVEFRSSNAKIDVCHYDAENDIWEVINISENAWPAHEGHGDVQLIDEDGDGWVTSANECGMPVDCDDTDDQLTDNCYCVEGELEVTLSNGDIIYVYPTDNSNAIPWGEYGTLTGANSNSDGFENTNAIVDALGAGTDYAAGLCASLSTEDCVWYLPSRDELADIWTALADTPEKRTQNHFNGPYYWSSNEYQSNTPANNALFQYFNNSGYTAGTAKSNSLSCRCVRR